MSKARRGPKLELSSGPLILQGTFFELLLLTRLPAYPAYDGSFATCTTSVPGGISGETTERTMAVAVRSLAWTI